MSSSSVRGVRRLGCAVLLLAACEAEVPSGPSVEIDALCDDVVSIVCAADAACCTSDTTSSECVEAQQETCEATLGALASDPRLGYSPERGGVLVRALEERADGCWEEPFLFDELAELFEGSGEAGADCTPRMTSGTITSKELRVATFSCSDGLACRLRLASDGSPRGVCEARDVADASACSHALDCDEGLYCNLPDGWRPGTWGDCQPRRTDGWQCESALECQSGYCGPNGCEARPLLERCLEITYPDLVLASEPLLYYRLGDAGATARDDSGNGHMGTYTEPTTREHEGAIAEDDDEAIELTGMGGHVRAPSLSEITIDGEVTIALWIARPEEGGGGPVLDAVSTRGIALRMSLAGGRLSASFLGEDDEAAVELASPDDAVGAGYHHVALTVGEGGARLFVDGNQVAILEGERELPVGAPLVFGFRAVEDPEMSTSFAGAFDEITVYGSALDAPTLRRQVTTAMGGPIANDPPIFAWSR